MGLATAINAGLQLVGGIAGANASRMAANDRRNAHQRALEEYMKVNMPNLSDEQISLIVPQLMGQLDPETEQVIELGPSEMQGVTADEQLAQRQQEALDSISEVAEGGLTEADMAAARQAQRQVDSANQARQKAILQNMAQRGTLGSGMELAARLSAGQQAAEQQASAQDALLQQAQQRALQAMTQQGSMATQMRGQDFNEQTARARAADEIARANFANQVGVQQRNVAARNQAQAANLAMQQQLENQRAATRNQQEIHNKGLLDRQFQRDAYMAKLKAGAHIGKGEASAQAQEANARGISNFAQAGSDFISGGGLDKISEGAGKVKDFFSPGKKEFTPSNLDFSEEYKQSKK